MNPRSAPIRHQASRIGLRKAEAEAEDAAISICIFFHAQSQYVAQHTGIRSCISRVCSRSHNPCRSLNLQISKCIAVTIVTLITRRCSNERISCASRRRGHSFSSRVQPRVRITKHVEPRRPERMTGGSTGFEAVSAQARAAFSRAAFARSSSITNSFTCRMTRSTHSILSRAATIGCPALWKTARQ